MKERSIMIQEFAMEMDMSEEEIHQLLNGKTELSSIIALKLENISGLSLHFWCNLEKLYRDKLNLIQKENKGAWF